MRVLSCTNMVVLIVLLCAGLSAEAKGGRGSSGGGRGSSGSRGSSSSSRGGSSSSSSGNRGSSSSSASRGTAASRSSYVASNTISNKGNKYSKSKSGIGSLAKSSTIKKGLAGAAAGYLTYKLGKNLLKAGVSVLAFNNYNYYWRRNQFNINSNQQMCSYQIQDRDQGQYSFANMWSSEQERITVLYYTCRASTSQYCCGMECCDYQLGEGSVWGTLLTIFIILLVVLCCGCCVFALLYKLFRSSLDCILGSDDKPADTVTYNVHDSYAVPAPNQYDASATYEEPKPYDPPSYPSQGGYPSQPSYPSQPATYPSQPPSYYPNA